jgi:carbonic anhydrase/acetyltransferase-like protein (isoleucine patch superfamily)
MGRDGSGTLVEKGKGSHGMIEFNDKSPVIAADAFVAQNACIIGDVSIGNGSGIWFNAVVRGDVGSIKIGDRTNIQDGCVLHMPPGGRISVGNEVTIGHRAIVHGCAIGNRTLVGMGSVIMDDAQIGDECLIAAGALVTEKTVIPPRSLVMGVPAKVKRKLTDEEVKQLVQSADEYAGLASRYREVQK